MSLADTRIQDPVLTQLAQGYYNAELAGESLFPAVEIYKEGGAHSSIRALGVP